MSKLSEVLCVYTILKSYSNIQFIKNIFFLIINLDFNTSIVECSYIINILLYYRVSDAWMTLP